MEIGCKYLRQCHTVLRAVLYLALANVVGDDVFGVVAVLTQVDLLYLLCTLLCSIALPYK